ncbi:metallo-beta-lactamase domain-containing protein 1-like [Gigantopelta aegis]|uniref:metallo-beta-lactamase domain-containing protein 1-like n=1 Tax=Gigantopelta aegis TaxID=1735272 RepID=UPI001B88CB23|nr:metallo-beta-lactamase domain-containing protein 1-like [Gigantopelta aegis]
MGYEVIVIKEGYCFPEGEDFVRACGSITLLKGRHVIIVDTGNPRDKNLILQGLSNNGLTPENVDYVVCTHGHADRVGNLNLFSRAIHIVAYDICVGDQYLMHDFKEGIPYEIDEFVEVIATPGRTGADVSVVVKKTPLGTVVLTGNLFECCNDLDDPQLWQNSSDEPEVQEQSRIKVLKVADHIIPGHGPMFKVPVEYKKQMRVLMVCEIFTVSETGLAYHNFNIIDQI